jgi:hypothetical protein
VFVVVVCNKGMMVWKVVVAILTIMMVGTLDVVFFEALPRREVSVAVVTEMMVRGVPEVLIVRLRVWEIPVTTLALDHDGENTE